jgi:hypothetical protein
MKKSIVPFIIFLFAAFSSSGQGGPYSLSAVPENVKNNANVITHLESIDLKVESIDKTTMSVHRIFTVLNEDGKRSLLFNEYTTKFISLEDAEIKVYDANGKQTGKYKKKDMTTVAVGEGLVDDGYVTYYPIQTASYPVTVDIKYEERIKSTLYIPEYRFVRLKEGIVESSYTAHVPPEINLRYKAKNISLEPEITDDGKYKTYKWSVKNLAPIDYEDGAASGSDKFPHVMIASDRFSHYGFEGDLSSWKNFGTWIKDLYEGLDVLPADRQQFFSTLIKDASSEKEKIKRIYNYMQANFRYVSIQLGIGGLRPFSAEFTDKKKYGDCKALSNYMKAALKSVGIKSHVAIINAEYDQEPVDPDFPINDFNHVILCVPGPKDSVWLECTSSTAEFGELGTFTENRNALLITDNGGVLVATPKSQSSTNTLSTVTNVKLESDLSALTETVLKDKKDDQKATLVFYFGFKQPDQFALARDEASDGHKTKLRMIISKVPEFNAGNKLFISPHVYRIIPKGLPKGDNRKSDYYFHFPYEKSDTTIFKLPAGYKTDALPNNNELKCDYASYKSKYWYNQTENAIYAATSIILKQHKIPAADYAGLKKFFDDVAQDDSQKIVLLKGEVEKKGF